MTAGRGATQWCTRCAGAFLLLAIGAPELRCRQAPARSGELVARLFWPAWGCLSPSCLPPAAWTATPNRSPRFAYARPALAGMLVRRSGPRIATRPGRTAPATCSAPTWRQRWPQVGERRPTLFTARPRMRAQACTSPRCPRLHVRPRGRATGRQAAAGLHPLHAHGGGQACPCCRGAALHLPLPAPAGTLPSWPIMPLPRTRCRPTPTRGAGAAFAASQGGHLFKLEDIALASWLEWAAQRGGFAVHRVTDRRCVSPCVKARGCLALPGAPSCRR